MGLFELSQRRSYEKQLTKLSQDSIKTSLDINPPPEYDLKRMPQFSAWMNRRSVYANVIIDNLQNYGRIKQEFPERSQEDPGVLHALSFEYAEQYIYALYGVNEKENKHLFDQHESKTGERPYPEYIQKLAHKIETSPDARAELVNNLSEFSAQWSQIQHDENKAKSHVSIGAANGEPVYTLDFLERYTAEVYGRAGYMQRATKEKQDTPQIAYETPVMVRNHPIQQIVNLTMDKEKPPVYAFDGAAIINYIHGEEQPVKELTHRRDISDLATAASQIENGHEDNSIGFEY